jgi:hypothetical protein
MSDDRERPEGVINASPAGAWEEADSPHSDLAESDAETPTFGLPGPIEVPPVEGSVRGTDPDLVNDPGFDEDRKADPAVDESEYLRREGEV